MISRRTPLLCALFLSVPGLPARSPQSQENGYLLRGAKVFTGKGAFRDGIQVLIQEGRIIQIGRDLPVPDDVKVLDLQGRWITPGLVDPNTSLGLPNVHENEEYKETTPHMKILEALDPGSQAFKHVLRDGVTTAYVSPGGRNVFGGLGVVLKTAGPDLESRIVSRDNGLRMTLGSMPSSGNRPFRGGSGGSMFYRRPTSRMGVIWEIRSNFYKAGEARASGQRRTERIDAATRVLIDALDRKIVVRTTARADQDIRTAFRLAEEFGLKIVIDECTEAYHAFDFLAAAKVPVVAAPPSVRNSMDGAEPHLDTIKLLADAGVPVAIQTGQGLGALPLIREAAFAVRYGLDKEKALEAVTSVPAEILGVEDRVGSLAPGLDADLVVWSFHPLSPFSHAERVLLDGRIARSDVRTSGSGGDQQ